MLEIFSQGWRIVATGLCFAVFGLGGLMLRCVVCPVFTLVVRDPVRQQRLSQSVIHHSFRWFVALMNFVGVISYEVRGRERLRRRGLLILANHPSLIDVVFLISFVRNADCIVKASLARNPFTRGPIRAAGFITNGDGVELLEDYQLQVEHTLDLVGRERVLFVDASGGCLSKRLRAPKRNRVPENAP